LACFPFAKLITALIVCFTFLFEQLQEGSGSGSGSGFDSNIYFFHTGLDNTSHETVHNPFTSHLKPSNQTASSPLLLDPILPTVSESCQSEAPNIATIPFLKEIFILLSARPP
jgi:hypothetical protein